jgi:hypothetical protein
MSGFSSVTTIAPTVVAADRLTKAESTAEVAYARGQSEFSQTLAKVEADPQVEKSLQRAGKLATPDTTLDTLVQASAQPDAPASAATGTIGRLQQALSAGADAMRHAARTGYNLHIKL